MPHGPFVGRTSWTAFTLFALPQEQELALVEEGVQRLKPKRQFRVFLLF
jgi:hypothetical protein